MGKYSSYYEKIRLNLRLCLRYVVHMVRIVWMPERIQVNIYEAIDTVGESHGTFCFYVIISMQLCSSRLRQLCVVDCTVVFILIFAFSYIHVFGGGKLRSRLSLGHIGFGLGAVPYP
jgi:Na+/glutamate symporter